jgi:hypothetical protein
MYKWKKTKDLFLFTCRYYHKYSDRIFFFFKFSHELMASSVGTVLVCIAWANISWWDKQVKRLFFFVTVFHLFPICTYKKGKKKKSLFICMLTSIVEQKQNDQYLMCIIRDSNNNCDHNFCQWLTFYLARRILCIY